MSYILPFSPYCCAPTQTDWDITLCLFFLCCYYSYILSSVCLCHVFIFYIVHAKYMSIFDRFLLIAALPLWPAVLQPSVLIFLCSYYLYILYVFISISLYTS